MIKTVVDETVQVTHHIFSGVITMDAILQEISAMYEGDVTPHQLWDFQEARITDMSPDQIKAIAEHANTFSSLRQGGKSAIIAGMKNKFTHVRMYELFNPNLSDFPY